MATVRQSSKRRERSVAVSVEDCPPRAGRGDVAEASASAPGGWGAGMGEMAGAKGSGARHAAWRVPRSGRSAGSVGATWRCAIRMFANAVHDFPKCTRLCGRRGADNGAPWKPSGSRTLSASRRHAASAGRRNCGT